MKTSSNIPPPSVSLIARRYLNAPQRECCATVKNVTDRVGDQVMATTEISAGFFNEVKRGTGGVVLREIGLWTTRYVVRFDTGDEVEVTAKEIRFLSPQR
ncbi:MAG: hypothetical protein LBH13_00575 [Cellulomonadaceae bacterium]|jgi:hypothetical protein|nr:hypothetical protein [Cellulomonadaceae bacterium]